jgi:hypothetical protein
MTLADMCGLGWEVEGVVEGEVDGFLHGMRSSRWSNLHCWVIYFFFRWMILTTRIGFLIVVKVIP